MHTTHVRAYVGVTDNEWYLFLAARPELLEVNFWQPSGGREFHVLAPGRAVLLQDPLPAQQGGGRRFLQRLDNGLLLRSDVHTLFDRGYVGVDPGYRLRVSPRLRDDFGNGDQFYARAGQLIDLPARRADRPQREFLEWHLDEVFKAS
jgi:hypothetical protein